MQISLISGETIGPFQAATTKGMKGFVQAYDKFLKGDKQERFRFKMSPISGAPETEIFVDFTKVLTMTTVTK